MLLRHDGIYEVGKNDVFMFIGKQFALLVEVDENKDRKLKFTKTLLGTALGMIRRNDLEGKDVHQFFSDRVYLLTAEKFEILSEVTVDTRLVNEFVIKVVPNDCKERKDEEEGEMDR